MGGGYCEVALWGGLQTVRQCGAPRTLTLIPLQALGTIGPLGPYDL